MIVHRVAKTVGDEVDRAVGQVVGVRNRLPDSAPGSAY
jgi:hypothetical protein